MIGKDIKSGPACQIATRDIMSPGAACEIAVRIHTPTGKGPFPVIVYFHRGGWVIADIDTYDASARSLALGAKAVVLSSHYRQDPVTMFPAAHDDANAAYIWAVEHSGNLIGDAKRMAVVCDSAGANLAAYVAIMAHDSKITKPIAQIDPLRSEGEAFGAASQAAGRTVEMKTYNGVTHEFFGMGAVVPQAAQAMDVATANLRTAFGN